MSRQRLIRISLVLALIAVLWLVRAANGLKALLRRRR